MKKETLQECDTILYLSMGFTGIFGLMVLAAGIVSNNLTLIIVAIIFITLYFILCIASGYIYWKLLNYKQID